MKPATIAATLLLFVVAMALSGPAPGATTTVSAATGTATVSTTSPTGPSTVPTDKYVAGQGARFETLAGSHDNLVSLVNGLRTGSDITLVSPTPTPTPTGTPPTVTKTTFTPPTRPMGYGNITHSLDFAQRELAAMGITNPTAAQLQAALNGGTVTTAKGDVQLQGVLQLRSQSMGWGKIAHTIGIFPSSHASANASSHAATPAGITTAAGTTGASASGKGNGQVKSGIVTAAGGTVGASSPGQGHAHSGIVTAAGGSSAALGNAGGNSGIRTGAGATGNGNAYGHAGK